MSKNTVVLIDIGNSTTTFVFRDQLFSECRSIETDALDQRFIDAEFKPYLCVISSVVPDKDALFNNCNTVFVTKDNVKPLSVQIDNPDQVGADRLVNALAAYTHYQSPLLILDSGTAFTGCFVDEKGGYQGGLIFPGMRLCSQALNDYTAKLPLIYVSKQEALFGKNTEDAVKVALYRGFIAMINGLIADFKQRYPNITVIGTGTGLEILKDSIHLDAFDDGLIFKGLEIISKNEEIVV